MSHVGTKIENTIVHRAEKIATLARELAENVRQGDCTLLLVNARGLASEVAELNMLCGMREERVSASGRTV